MINIDWAKEVEYDRDIAIGCMEQYASGDWNEVFDYNYPDMAQFIRSAYDFVSNKAKFVAEVKRRCKLKGGTQMHRM